MGSYVSRKDILMVLTWYSDYSRTLSHTWSILEKYLSPPHPTPLLILYTRLLLVFMIQITTMYYFPGGTPRAHPAMVNAPREVTNRVTLFRTVNQRWIKLYIDGHESKPAISILANFEKSQQTSNFRYFVTYSFHVLT